MDTNVLLETRPIGDIKGTFYVPNYQRGYRWTSSQVEALLNDIWDSSVRKQETYCLQPIVLKRLRDMDTFELIDGQQRFTTILILLNYIKKEYVPRTEIKYSLEYETRANTSLFLANITEEEAQTNIDFYHIYNANECIKEWANKVFNGDDNAIGDAMFQLRGYLFNNTKVIWYEVDDDEDSISLFTRLNIGKIGLTNAELIRALLLKRKDNDTEKDSDQTMKAVQWDKIEKELRAGNDELWSFISRKSPSLYPTRLEILFEIMSGIREEHRRDYDTFYWFEKEIKEKGVKEVWRNIQLDFLKIKDWYSDGEFYHKIGYLISSGHKTMGEIFELAKGKRKSEFRSELDGLIAESIDFKMKDDETLRDLNYESDKWKISRILLLFNIQSIIKEGAYQRFPFSKYNNLEWSLEHIHAQQSEGLKNTKLQLEWISMHIDSVKAVSQNDENLELIEKMESIVASEVIESRNEFDNIFKEVCNVLSEDGDSEYIHTLANMALLTKNNNAALNNSTFDVKRNMIVEMDQKGAFIPYCTKMVFLKYYTPSNDNQVHFWGKKDRDAYMKAMSKVLNPYLTLINKTI